MARLRFPKPRPTTRARRRAWLRRWAIRSRAAKAGASDRKRERLAARRRAKRNAAARTARRRKKCREQTVKDWGYACACRRDECGRQSWRELHIHEEPPRSRGGDPLDPLDCLPLTRACHRKRTGDVGIGQPVAIEVADPRGQRCRGPLIFREGAEVWLTVPWSTARWSILYRQALISDCRRRGGTR